MPDQEMIDKVAEAIFDTPDFPASTHYNRVAINAIKAMCEPTQKMINSGIRKGVDIGMGINYTCYEDVYKAMIDSITND